MRDLEYDAVKKTTATGHRGRPPLPRDQVRGNRVVTFVTDKELEKLHYISGKEKETLSSVCHEIISKHLQSISAK